MYSWIRNMEFIYYLLINSIFNWNAAQFNALYIILFTKMPFGTRACWVSVVFEFAPYNEIDKNASNSRFYLCNKKTLRMYFTNSSYGIISSYIWRNPIYYFSNNYFSNINIRHKPKQLINANVFIFCIKLFLVWIKFVWYCSDLLLLSAMRKDRTELYHYVEYFGIFLGSALRKEKLSYVCVMWCDCVDGKSINSLCANGIEYIYILSRIY